MINPWSKANDVSHGINELFSTGSQAQYPPHPNVVYAQYPPIIIPVPSESETNKLYLEMLRQSLEGKPVADVIKEREAASQPVLSKAEFDAVMELNRNLRFG